jgi:multidrug efflux system membrane fusion protein
MNRRWILTSALATTATVLALAPAWAADTPSAQAVKSMAAKTNGAGLQELSLDAVVEAVRQASLSAQVAGAIVSLSVKAGDRVKSGQELLRIDASAAQQNVVGSTAQLEAAQANLLSLIHI